MGLASFTYQTKLKTNKYYFRITNMEKFLKQIANNTEPKRSFSIVVSDSKTRFKTWFKPPIQLDKNESL